MRSSTSSLRKLLLSAAIVLLLGPAAAADSSNEEIFRQGSELLQHGDYAAAETAFLTVLKSEPSNLGALGNLGVVYARTNRTAKAIDTYERALKLAPQQQGLLLNLGLAHLKSEQYSRALPNFTRIEQLDSNNLQARELAATCRLFSGDSAAAIQELEALRPIDPNKSSILYLLGVAYTRAKQPDKAKPVFEEMLSSAVTPAQADFLLGRINYDGGRFDQAETSLLDALKKDPDLPGAHLALAKVYISKRENNKALAELQAVIAAHSDDVDAQYLLGALLVGAGKYAEAVRSLAIAQKGLPDSWAVFYYLGKAKLKLGETEQAITLLQHSSELDADEGSVYYLLGQAYRAAGRTDDANTALARLRTLRAAALKKEEVISERIPGTQPIAR